MAMILSQSRLRLTEAKFFGNALLSGQVSSLTQGNGIVLTPNPIVATGAIALSTPVTNINGGTGANTSATGGVGQYVKQAGLGAAFTVGTIPVGDLSGVVRTDGTAPLTADWNAGNFRVDSQNSTRWFNVVAYGADPTGVADSTAGVNAAIAAAAAAGGGVVHFPRGLYKIAQSGSASITIANDNIMLQGEGKGNTTISYIPSGGGPVFIFSAGASMIGRVGISGFSFTSPDTTTQKTMMRVSDCDHFAISNIASADNAWKGATSIGVQFRGRQELRPRDCQIYADQPVQIETNPNAANISFDHSSIESSDLVVTSGLNNPCINILDGVVLSQAVFRDLAFVRGNGGIFYNDTTLPTVPQGILIENCRSEQTNSAAGYSIDIRSSAQQLQNINIRNCILDPGMNGIRLTNAKWPLVQSVTYGGTGTFLNLSATVNDFTIINSFYQTGGTITDSSTNPTAIGLVFGTNAPLFSVGSLTTPTRFTAAYFSNGPETTVTLSNGDNNNVAVTSGWVKINGPTGAFAITGIAGGVDGEDVTFYNNVAQTLTIKYSNAGSSVGNKLLFKEAADTAIGAGFAWFRARWSAAQNAWIVMGHS